MSTNCIKCGTGKRTGFDLLCDECRIPTPKLELVSRWTCQKCGKEYGKTNLTYGGVELWQACDCMDQSKAYLLDMNSLREGSPEECDHDWELIADDNGMSPPYQQDWSYRMCIKCGEQKDP